ncbi:MAG TPA: hypothetical protein VG294_04995 [Solirubrobacteraceae bacterium]|jgi:hypothetical protein|nr:hypothetical protein [Solirubrobacteraceae bacterium]
MRKLVAAGSAVLAICATGTAVALAGAGSGPSATITARVDEHTVHFSRPLHAGLLRLHIVSTGVEPHHLIFWQLNPGVTFKQFAATQNRGNPFKLSRIVGGNGQLAPGTTMDIWIHVAKGRLVVMDIPAGNGKGFARNFTVSASGPSAAVPTALGVVAALPTDRYRVPPGFAAAGTWEFDNTDSEAHEASIVRLSAGKTVADLVSWAKHGEKGFPPIDGLKRGVWGGFGALSGHSHAWFTHGTLPAGNYALVCFLPGPNGMPHLAMGMAAPFTVSG